MNLLAIKKHPIFQTSVFRSNFVMVIGTNIYSFTQFIYHFLAGRYLGRESYGDLVALVSLLGFTSIIQLALGLTVVNHIAGGKDKDNIPNFIKWVSLWSFWLGMILAAALLAASPVFIKFIKLTQPPLFYFLPLMVFGVIAVGFGRSVLQGLMYFNKYVVSLMVEASIKIIFTVIFILVGFASVGALGGFLLGLVAAYIVNQYLLSGYMQKHRGPRPAVIPLLKYSSATLMQGLALTSMYSADLVLVKHFFTPSEAGLYASVAILGRIVFFSPTPVINVMFPMVAERFSKGVSTGKLLWLSLIAVSGISLLVTLLYFVLPKIPILLLYGESYLPGSSMLGWYGVFMTLLAVAMLLTQYYLSIKKIKIVGLFLIAALFQIIMIFIYHSSLLAVIQVSIVTTALLDLGLFIYLLYPAFLKSAGQSK